MKFTMELNDQELKTAINNGTLAALTESIDTSKNELSAIADTKSTNVPAPQPIQQVYTQASPQQMAPVYNPPVAQAQPIQPTQPTQQPQYTPLAQAPAQQYQVQQQSIPTTAPTYTLDQLSVAATQLMDAGRRQELVSLLATFGVPSMMALPKEQFGAFATQLRAMGAKI